VQSQQVQDYQHHLVEALRVFRLAARVALDVAQISQKNGYDKNRRIVEFKNGERVWLYTPKVDEGGSKKLSRPWSGPYFVSRVVGSVNYQLQSGQNQRLKQLVHVSRLKKWIPFRLLPSSIPLLTADSFDPSLEELVVAETGVSSFYGGTQVGARPSG
jgi:hypothetical protein